MIESIELNEIKEDFDNVIKYSQNIPNPRTDELFLKWRENKEKFFHYFKNNFIYEYPEKVTFELSEKEKKKRIVDFIEQTYSLWDCKELSLFIKQQEDGFFDNSIIEDFKTPEGRIIKKGSKLIKSFKYFVPEGRKLIDIQNEASKIVQENKIEGFLCLSIHPLDFLSLSENSCNWRSCHSLDGDYRAGNLSYMIDKCTMVAYLKSEKNEKISLFPYEVPWNNKKWRMLVYLSEDENMLFAGRQYPFESQSGRDFVLKSLLKESNIISEDETNKWSDWSNIKYNNFNIGNCSFSTPPYIALGDGLILLSDLIKDLPGSRQYNDLLRSKSYDALYSFKYSPQNCKPYTKIKSTSFKIGGKVSCLRCGDSPITEIGYGSMMCDECTLNYGEDDLDVFGYCDCCGSRYFLDDGSYVEDQVICPQCKEEETFICECCGELTFKEHRHFDEESNMYLCEECFFEKN